MRTCTTTALLPPHRKPAGMVLLLCLIFLMALTLLGLSASSDAILQDKLSNNLQDNERARQSALLGLAWAEKWLLEFNGLPPETCTGPCDGLYLHPNGGLPTHPQHESHSWWLTQGQEAGIDPLTGVQVMRLASGSVRPPVWIVEQLESIPASVEGSPDLQVWYRILVRGSGQTDNAVSVVESTLVRSWPLVEDAELANSGLSGSCPGSGHPTVCGRFSWRELR